VNTNFITEFKRKIWLSLDKNIKWFLLWLFQTKYIVGVSGIIENDNKLLLLNHKYWREGSWGFPSGTMIMGETPEEAIKREVLEETGLNINVIKVVKVTSAYKLQVEITFLANIIGGELILDNREIIKVGFFYKDQLPENLISRHKDLLRDYLEGVH
jgi:ADP-ribose pyrophosphatase YjhB (NUDIX family)